MPIFQKSLVTTGISDRMTLGGLDFDAQLVVSEENGNAAAINSGRILSLQITCEDEVIAYFEDGIWYQLPDNNFEEGILARELFVQKWSKCEPIRKEIEYMDAMLEGKIENWITEEINNVKC